jgi:hypothetical protein
MTGNLVPEEQDLAAALIEIATKYGKFNEDETGIWADYHEPADNPYAPMGVKCGNCVLYQGGTECKIIAFEVHPDGYCRFAVLPDGSVDPSKAPVGMDEDVATTEYFPKRPSQIEDYIKTITSLNDPDDIQEVDVNKLIPTQNTVNLRRVKDVQNSNKPIKVWVSPTGMKIVDGHHRAVSHIMRGTGKIVADLYYPSDSPIRASLLAAAKPTITPDALELVTEDPCWEGYKQIGMKEKDGKMVPNCVPIDASVTELATTDVAVPDCPPATQDIAINLQNREKAITTAGYGPLNPKEPNEDFWAEKAKRWSLPVADAKKSVCGNCVMFIRTPSMLDCIETGLAAGESGSQNAWDAIDTAELGYCEAFDFKCAASRTCSAWVVGGPITDDTKQTN